MSSTLYDVISGINECISGVNQNFRQYDEILSSLLSTINEINTGNLSGDITDLATIQAAVAAIQTALNTKANVFDIPAKTSQLINDSEFVTSTYVETELEKKLEARKLVVDNSSTNISIDLDANTDYVFTLPLNSLEILSAEKSFYETNVYFNTGASFDEILYPTDNSSMLKGIGNVQYLGPNKNYVMTVNNGIVVVAEAIDIVLHSKPNNYSDGLLSIKNTSESAYSNNTLTIDKSESYNDIIGSLTIH